MVRFFPLPRVRRLARRLLLAWPAGAAIGAVQDAASRRAVRRFEAGELPATITVETCTACNNDCAFCPQSSDPRPRELMSEAVFDRLAERLSEAGFRGRLILSLNNEPLVDPRLEEFVRRAREVRGASIGILTNGLVLTRERAEGLYRAGLDWMTVNSYSSDGRTVAGAAGEWLVPGSDRADFEGRLIEVHYRLKDEVLDNRAGNAPNKPACGVRRAGCLWPFTLLPVTVDGSAFLCCNDFRSTTRFATVEEFGLAGLWRHPYLEMAREKLRSAGREYLPLCAKCDFKGYLNPAPVWWARMLGI